MAEQQHTPGPWIVSDSWKRNKRDRVRGKDREILVLAEDLAEASICHVATLEADRPEDIHKREMANAYLIAAAPEMYEALKGVCRLALDYAETGCLELSELLPIIGAALAKAEVPNVR